MFARIAINCTATIFPFYLQISLGFKGTADRPTSVILALVPLSAYVASMLFSLFLQAPMTQKFANRLKPLAIAVFLVTISSIPLLFLDGVEKQGWGITWLVFPLAMIQGLGIAILLNTSTSCISDVIGNDNTSSAFVYGIYSLLDKVSNGIILAVLIAKYSEDAQQLKYILAFMPTLAAVSAGLCTWIGTAMYSKKLAKISMGSKLKPANRDRDITEVE